MCNIAVIYYLFYDDKTENKEKIVIIKNSFTSIVQDIKQRSNRNSNNNNIIMDLYVLGYCVNSNIILLLQDIANNEGIPFKMYICQHNVGKAGYCRLFLNECDIISIYNVFCCIDHDIVMQTKSTLENLAGKLLTLQQFQKVGILAPLQLEDNRHHPSILNGIDLKDRTDEVFQLVFASKNFCQGVAQGCVAMLPCIFLDLCNASITKPYWSDEIYIATRLRQYNMDAAIDKVIRVVHPYTFSSVDIKKKNDLLMADYLNK